MSATATTTRTFTADGDTDIRNAGQYEVVLTLRQVAGNRWYRLALTQGGTFGLEGAEVDGWVADHADLDRARAEANRAVCVFRSGRSVEDVAAEYAEAQDTVWRSEATYSNVSAHALTVARATMDLLAPLAVAQRQHDLAARFAVAA
jgi:hypothetical protein